MLNAIFFLGAVAFVEAIWIAATFVKAYDAKEAADNLMHRFISHCDRLELVERECRLANNRLNALEDAAEENEVTTGDVDEMMPAIRAVIERQLGLDSAK